MQDSDAPDKIPLPWAADIVFLAVIFGAVYIRKFGQRWFVVGMIAFMSYFMGDYLRPALRLQPDLAAVWEPFILSSRYDAALAPMSAKSGGTVGMTLTEKQAGSDLRAMTSTANALPPDPAGLISADDFSVVFSGQVAIASAGSPTSSSSAATR